MREEMRNLSDEDFETNRNAVLTKVQQKDVNLSQVSTRMMNQIALHSYRFNYQNE
jgi:secreted Zn-dependent insulinase-like peptidase